MKLGLFIIIAIKLRGFGGQIIPVKYVIEWYNALTMQQIGPEVIKWVQPGGKLRLNYPTLLDTGTGTSRFIVAYKIRRQGEPSFLHPNNETMAQDLSKMIEEVFLINDLLATDINNRGVEKGEIGEEIVNTNVSNTVLQITPNPTSGNILITFNGKLKDTELTIVNSLGKVVLKDKLTNPQVTKDLSGQPKGVYIVFVSNKEDKYSQQIILE